MEMHDECMAWLILFQFDDFAFAGDAENFELIACRVVLPWGFFFLIRRFGQRVGQDPDPWSIRSIVPRCCFFANENVRGCYPTSRCSSGHKCD